MRERQLREPRQQRSRVTKQRVLEAAIESLAQVGWAESTVAVVAARAGVSRGAAQYHFPSKESLFKAAVEYVTEVRLTEIRQGAATLPPDEGRTEAVLTMLTGLYTGPLFQATLQMWSAAATEPTLHAQVVALERHIGRQAHQVALELLGASEAKSGTRQTVQGMLDMARGLGLAAVLTDDAARRTGIIEQWAKILDDTLDLSHGTR